MLGAIETFYGVMERKFDMRKKPTFTEIVDAHDCQAIQESCQQDWIEDVHFVIFNYFKECEKSGKRASITTLREKILEVGKNKPFNFDDIYKNESHMNSTN